MIIPSGMTVNIGRKEYREGMELPANAPDSTKKLVSERIMRPHHLGKFLCIGWKAGHKMPSFIRHLTFFFPPKIDKSYRLYCIPPRMTQVQPSYIIAYR